MERMLHLGPLVLPWALLIMLAGWQLGVWVHERLSVRRGLAPGPHRFGRQRLCHYVCVLPCGGRADRVDFSPGRESERSGSCRTSGFRVCGNQTARSRRR